MRQFVEDSYIWHPKNISEVLYLATDEDMLVKTGREGYVYNLPASFDIETTSFYVDSNGNQLTYEEKEQIKQEDETFNPEKRAIMYVWQLGINGQVIIGRTWDEFSEVLHSISSQLELNENKKLIIYVHNLSYEFQFIRKRFKWLKVFSLEERKPIYALSDMGIEFRCSYLLSGYSLANLGKQLTKYPVAKMVGDLDYSLIRHHATKLTDKELGYCINDVRVVMAYIQEEIERNGNISKIPLTKTGYVRKYCRAHTIKHSGTGNTNRSYTRLIKDLIIKDVKEFDMMQRAFQGGFTHANAYYMGGECYEVASYDFTSSYPAVMLSEQFPMSKGRKVQPHSMNEFKKLLANYCCIFDCRFKKLKPKVLWENPLSSSKCWTKEKVIANNGRVVMADLVGTTITDVDFAIMEGFYTWEEFQIGEMYIYKRGYLPKELLDCILTLYENKTKLKGVEGKEVEYLQSKAMINAVYGMCVTNILRDEILYENDEWGIEHAEGDDKANLLFKNNHSRNRFLFYPWGVFVTAYARRNLFTGILALGNDYIYADTDSIKCFNHKNHAAYFDWYNKRILAKLARMADFYGFSYDRFAPKTIEGETKPIGVWDYEGEYTRFKTLGAKRYMVEKPRALVVNGKEYPISLTVSGVNKFTAIPYMLEKYGDVDSVFKAFDEYLEIPPGDAGKLLHMYIDEEKDGLLVDYQGIPAYYDELSAVHLENAGYNLSIANMYIAYVANVKTRLL